MQFVEMLVSPRAIQVCYCCIACQLHVRLFELFNMYVFNSRPKSVDEVAYQEEVVAVLKKSLQGCDVSI